MAKLKKLVKNWRTNLRKNGYVDDNFSNISATPTGFWGGNGNDPSPCRTDR
jgi:hypothetical protein